jgi:GDP-mannose transporter
MIYTGAKALKFLSIPVYTIFKNLTIILIAYGEVLWFGGSVTPMTLFSFGLMVVSSIIAAWADIRHALGSIGEAATPEATEAISTLNAGYLWMLFNCFCTASYVLGMRKRIKLTNFKDFDSKCNEVPCASSRTDNYDSHVLQQPPYYPDSPCCVYLPRGLVIGQHCQELPC